MRNNIGAASVDITTDITTLINGSNINYISKKALNPNSGELIDNEDCIVTDKIPVYEGDIVTWNVGVDYTVKEIWLVEYDAQNSIVDKWKNLTSPRTVSINHSETAYIRATFLFNSRDTSKVRVNSIIKWSATEYVKGINEKIESLEDVSFQEHIEENSTTLIQGTIFQGILTDATNNVSDAMYHRVNDGTMIKVNAQ